jgi:dTDP-4-dehydrorhamnose reductase
MLDLLDPSAIRALVREIQPAVIVNAAAYTAVDQAEKEAEQAGAINGIAPGILAEEAQRVGAAIVHYSTDYVFDGRGERPWTERDSTVPLNEYGRSKLAGEKAIQASGAPHLILRTSWIYGVGGRNFVATMLRLGQSQKTLSVVDDQIGSPTSARVVAGITAEILSRASGDFAQRLRQQGGLIHLSCAGETSWHGFALEIFRLAKSIGIPSIVEQVVPVASASYPTAAKRPHNSRLDNTLLFERFSLAAPDWRAALADTFGPLAAALRGASNS